MRQTYLVPVRESQAGTLALRTGRLTSGERVGLAFTCEASLLLTMGPFQQWIRLAAEPLRDMLAPLGVECVRIDPRPASELRPGGLPQHRATGDAEPHAAKASCAHRARQHGRSHGCHAARQVIPVATGRRRA
ncbi:MAG TPA: SAV_915 family protein [Streptosporangiaceae bacterium]|nr:SAV_915 family protein [Streptosporangiaceae bacterium]